jgi:MoaA/NifB/PqqE/SkfB family radical SAM enzyme
MFDINPEHFKTFLISCKPFEIFFCGNWGDPIYAEDFLGLLASIKSELPDTRIVLHTNGSGKSTAWWEQFASMLSDKDIIFFSIDGTPENYATYRVNSKWEDVENAVKTCIAVKEKLKLKTTYIWKHLVFSYNENTIIEAYNKSLELGLDFQLQESMVFGYLEKTTVGGGTWLRISKPFSEIEKEFNEQKNKSLL